MAKYLMLGLAFFFLATTGRAGEVRFERVEGERHGIAAALQQWHQLEMERQGGPGKSHGWWPWGLRAFDFDRDGLLDFIISHHGTPRSLILRGQAGKDGELRFTDITKSLGVDYRDLPAADDRPWIWDFDGDGFLDIAGFSDEASATGSAWNREGKQLVADKGRLFGALSHPREVVDLNGDGYLDLDGGSQGKWLFDAEKKTFRHDPSSRFELPKGVTPVLLEPFQAHQKSNRFFRVEALTHDVVGYDTLGFDTRPIDLNGDGRNDVVLTGSGGYGAQYLGRYLLRQEDGSLADCTTSHGLPENGVPIWIRDLTGDGRPEILIVANKAGEHAGGLFLNDGHGKFTRVEGPLTNFLERRGPYLIRAYQADFDNDGLLDLVLSNPRLGSMAIYHNEGAGKFTEVLKLSSCWDSNPIVLADFNGDGRVDLAVGLRPQKDSPGDVHLFLNRSEGAGNYLAISPRMSAPNPYAVGAVVEVFAAGDAAKKEAQPLFVEKAHPDATPVLVGLGARTACDVRVIFPGGATVVREIVATNRSLTISP